MRFASNISVLTSNKFPGGTSTALATELPSLTKIGLKTLYCPAFRMFRKQSANPHLESAARQLSVEMSVEFHTISARTVVLHNPLIFKFDETADFRIVCENFVCVMHENILYPNGMVRFDYQRILKLLDDIVECRSFIIAPISGVSRACIPPLPPQYRVSELDWNNIIDSGMIDASPSPRDRRGRHSRPGTEKWPAIEDLRHCFAGGKSFILGADYIRNHDHGLENTEFYDYGDLPVDRFLNYFDFFVYFHSPSWRESFGRVIAEAICAGKLVITHDYVRNTFDGACVYCVPERVNDVISGYLDQPECFVAQVAVAQADMMRFSRAEFENKWFPLIG